MTRSPRLDMIIILSVFFAAVEWGTDAVLFGVTVIFVFGLGIFIGRRVTPRR